MAERLSSDPWSEWFSAFSDDDKYCGFGIFEDISGGVINLNIDSPKQTRINVELGEVIADYSDALAKTFSLKSKLNIVQSELGVFSKTCALDNSINFSTVSNEYSNSSSNIFEKYDFILADYYAGIYGSKLVSFLDVVFNKVLPNKYILLSLDRKEFCSLEFRDYLKSHNHSVLAVLELKDCQILDSAIDNIFLSLRSKGLFLVFIQSQAREELTFYACSKSPEEFKSKSGEFLQSDYDNLASQSSLLEFPSILGEDRFLADKRLKAMLCDYSSTEFVKFENFILEASYDDNIQESDDVIVLNTRRVEKKDREEVCVDGLEIYEPNNFVNRNISEGLRVVIDKNIILKKYLEYFFRSMLFITQKSFYAESVSQPLSLLILNQFLIPKLSISDQQRLIASVKKIEDVNKRFQSFNLETIWNPNTFINAINKIDNVLSELDELADYDIVKRLIYSGESKTIEFKETFSLDISKSIREKYIEDACIKTIAAFLNSEGGSLLVGVSDEGEIKGIEREVYFNNSNFDKFLLHFKNIIKSRIGEQFYPLVNHRLVEVDQKFILLVECKSSEMEVYVDQKDFFVRTNPSTDKLEGPKLVAYIRNRFKN